MRSISGAEIEHLSTCKVRRPGRRRLFPEIFRGSSQAPRCAGDHPLDERRILKRRRMGSDPDVVALADQVDITICGIDQYRYFGKPLEEFRKDWRERKLSDRYRTRYPNRTGKLAAQTKKRSRSFAGLLFDGTRMRDEKFSGFREGQAARVAPQESRS